MDRQRLLLNPVNGQRSLKKQRLRQPPPDEYYSQSTQGYMLNNGAVVYADLALSQRAAVTRPYLPPQHVPLPMYHPHPLAQRSHTEYAVIKFHDVGQEIDV